MKRVIELKEGDNVNTILTNLAKQIDDEKKPDMQPGQIVIKDVTGKVVKVSTITGQKNNVEQAYKDQLDVNKLLEPAMKKGLLRHVTKFEGEYDDIPAGDFQEAQFIVAKGKSMFEQLPFQIRDKFEGDPAKFMQFVQDPKNQQWLKDNGILKGLDGLNAEGVRVADNPNTYDNELTPEVETPPEEQ